MVFLPRDLWFPTELTSSHDEAVDSSDSSSSSSELSLAIEVRAREGRTGGRDTFENEEEDGTASVFFSFPLVRLPIHDCHVFVSAPVSGAYGVTCSSLGVDMREEDVSLLPDIDLVVGGAEPFSEPD
jgi:hypothetical protein